MKMINKERSKLISEDDIYNRVLPVCENDVEREYLYVHSIRFSFILSKILPRARAGMCIANIGISIFDPYIKKILEELSVSYFNLVPNSDFINKLHNSNFYNLNMRILDVCSPNLQLEDEHLFDMVLFYETMEHLLAPDELIITNISNILKPNGKLMGSVPNALSIGRRIDVILGKNVHWPKKDIVSGVFGGYGHIREYSKYEIESILSNEFVDIKMYGYSPYFKHIRYFTKLIPSSFRSTIFFEAEKASSR